MMNLDALLLDIEKKLPGKTCQRLVMQLQYARRVALVNGEKYDALLRGAMEKVLALHAENSVLTRDEIGQIETMLLPMQADCKKYTWLMVGHAHIDMNWMWSYPETVQIVLDTFRTMLNLMKAHPEFTFAQSQASTYAIVEEFEPEMLEEIRGRIAEGRWEVTASSWVEPDHNMPNLESEIRHLLYTRQYLTRLLGVTEESLNLDFEPDTFGHNGRWPDVAGAAGVKYFYHCRGERIEGLYRWRGQSGNELLAFCEPDWYGGTNLNDEVVQRVPDFCEKFGIPAMLTVYGVGDHGGGPTNRDLYHIEDMMSWPIFPTVKFGTYREFYAMAEAVRESLPVLEGERNVMFSGCYTTQTRIKRGNAMAERQLRKGEMFSAFAHEQTGAPYRRADLEKAWRRVLFNHFHDIIPGSGVPDTREYAMGEYQKVYAAASAARRNAYLAISDEIDTSDILTEVPRDDRGIGGGVGFGVGDYRLSATGRGAGETRIFHLFNAMETAFDGIADLVIWDYTEKPELMEFVDENGNVLPHQMTNSGHDGYWGHDFAYVLVKTQVPACGYRTITLRKKEDAPVRVFHQYIPQWRTEDVFDMTLENDLIRAEFDPVTGRLAKLTDKKTGEVKVCDAGFDMIDEDPSEGMTAWTIGRYMNVRHAGTQPRITRDVWGNLRRSYRVKMEIASDSFLEYVVHLDEGSANLVYDMTCIWHERGNDSRVLPQLSFGVKTAGSNDAFTYRNAGGEILRKGAPQDKPSLFGMAGGDVTLMCDSRYGFRGDGDAMRVTLIRATTNPDPLPEKGEIRCRVAVGLLAGQTLTHAADVFCQPVDFVSGTTHEGTLKKAHSFLQLLSGDAEISGVKLAEEGDTLVIHVANRKPEAQKVTLALDREAQVCKADLLGHETGDAWLARDGKITLDMAAHEVCALHVLKGE